MYKYVICAGLGSLMMLSVRVINMDVGLGRPMGADL